MARSFLSVTAGSGTKLATNNYTDGADSKHDEIVVLGEQFLPTYSVGLSGSSIATVNDHLLQIMAGASLKVRIRRIRLVQASLSGATNTAQFNIFRLTTAGTGGTAVTPTPFDTTDSASGATAMALPTAKGTEGGLLVRAIVVATVSAQPVGADSRWEWEAGRHSKPIIIPAGTANGIAIKITAAVAATTLAAMVEFDESAY